MTLSIIILSYNTKVLLRQCLLSVIRNQSSVISNLELIVVDNASSDGSSDMVRHEFPAVKLFCMPQNIGFAAGNNQGIIKSHGEYIMLLNSDAEITDAQTIPQLIQYLDDHPQVGIITPKVVLPDGSLDQACHRGMPTPWNALCYFSGLEKLFPRSKIFSGYHQGFLDLSQTHSVPAVAATAVIVRRQAIDQVGLLDERFFLYGEDLDWCKRFTDAGWNIIYYPLVSVLHHKSASGKNKTADKDTRAGSVNYFYDTMKLFYDKHYRKNYPRWVRQLINFGIDVRRKLHH